MQFTWRRVASGFGVLACLALMATAAHAQIGSPQYSSIVIDAASGAVLSADNPDDLHHPASLTKMMTLYMLFEALRDHRVSIDQLVPVSEHAASMEPTKLSVPPGGELTVEQAIFGIVTLSANDAASALGELLGGGDEDRFAEMMTLRAHALGMTHTTFRNASGLPDPDQWTTARDVAILSRHLIEDFPNEYHYFSTPSFVFHGRVILNHDTMLRSYPGADGLKTGWIRTSGHNLATSAMRGNVRLVGVVLGAGSNGERDMDMTAQLDSGFQGEGVPVLVARREINPGFAGLLASAHAAPMPRAARFRAVAARGFRTPAIPPPATVQIATMEMTPRFTRESRVVHAPVKFRGRNAAPAHAATSRAVSRAARAARAEHATVHPVSFVHHGTCKPHANCKDRIAAR